MENFLIGKAFQPFADEKKPLPATDSVEASTKKPITAKLNFTEVGVCPYCQKPMSKSIACDQQVFVCHNDRFVSPLPNEQE